MKFTDAAIRALTPSAARYEKWDANGRGFGIRVTPKGTKTWIGMLRFRGKSRRMSYGCYAPEHVDHLSLAEARAQHNVALRKLERGIDPAAELTAARAEQRTRPTLGEFARYFLQTKPSIKSEPRHRTFEQYEQLLNHHILPALGEQPIADIKRRDVVATIDRIRATGRRTTANRVQAVLVRLFNVALDKGWIDATPLARLRMPRENPRDRLLTPAELDSLWRETQGTEVLSLALRLALLTAQRRSEVAKARWQDIDMEVGVWTIPAALTKNGRAHRVPLSSAAQRVLTAARTLERDGWVFPSPCHANGSIDPNSLNRALARFQPSSTRDQRYTVHDFRRTAATAMEEAGVSRVVVGAVLNHIDQSVTARHYARHSYEAEKRAALETWALRLSAPKGTIRLAA